MALPVRPDEFTRLNALAGLVLGNLLAVQLVGQDGGAWDRNDFGCTLLVDVLVMVMAMAGAGSSDGASCGSQGERKGGGLHGVRATGIDVFFSFFFFVGVVERTLLSK